MAAAGTLLGFYPQEEAFKNIDFNTLGLLLGMILIASILKTTGFFSYAAIKVAKFAGASYVKLLLLFSAFTATTSMLIDNVTTIVLIAPITILVAQMLGISPVPLLLAEVMLSNIGGVGTLVGDPPNILIGSAAGFSFNDFLSHTLPPTLLVGMGAVATFLLIFRKELSIKPKNFEAVMAMDEKEALKDKRTLYKVFFSLIITFTLFATERRLGIESSFAALFGAATCFALCRPSTEEILKDVEWSVLAFFLGLFVLVGGIEHTKLFSFISKALYSVAKNHLSCGVLLLLWGSATLSAFLGNVPFVAAMIPIIKKIATFGVNPNPLWWTLALGCGFGGNATPVGAAANVVVLSMSERARFPLTFFHWIKIGTLIAFVSCLISSFYLLLLLPFFK